MKFIGAGLGLSVILVALPAAARTSASVGCSVGSYLPVLTAACPGQSVENPSGAVSASVATNESFFVASASAEARSNYGDLGVRTAWSLDAAQNTLNFHSANVVAAWEDQITPQSATLAPGTPVVISLVTEITATLDWNLPPNQLASFSVLSRLGGFVQGDCVRMGAPVQGCMQATPGAPITLRQELSFAGAIGATVALSVFSEIAQQAVYVNSGSYIGIDSWSSARTYLRTDLSDVTIASLSGHDYSPSPVPEPAPVEYLMMGLVAFAASAARGRISSGRSRAMNR
jgi:hypothetical protein